MEKKYSLELLLSVTSNYQLVNDQKQLYSLMEFVFRTKINDNNYPLYINNLISHLIKIHNEELYNNYYDDKKHQNPVEWLIEQKIRYGDYLLVCEYGKELSKKESAAKRRLLVRK